MASMLKHQTAQGHPPAPTITEPDAARYLSHSVFALRDWRRRGCGPDYIRFGRSIRYTIAALDRFLEEHTVRSKG
jgi:hypothetical protein